MTSPHMESVIQQYRKCFLRPKGFFVAWNGVLALVYAGFPPELEKMKEELSTAFPCLPRENPGSLWPKTSVAALEEGRRLTPDQFIRLRAICRKHSEILLSGIQDIKVESLDIVLYACRSLERILSRKEIPLADPPDTSPPSPPQVQNVDSVIQQAEGEDYWFHVSKDGNRAPHYIEDATGSTLVHPLQLSTRAYEAFRKDVEEAFPQWYCWFSTASLHITIRAFIL